MEDLGGKVLAVELGALGHVKALDWQRRLSGLDVQTYGSVDEAMAAVAMGNADAALVDNVSGQLYLRDHPDDGQNLTRIPDPVTSEPYAAVVRIADRELHKNLNSALRKLDSTGKLDAIIARWLGP
jgi:ABC-type amino acid transport substrate-binding protein